MHAISSEYKIKAKDFISAGEGSIKIKNTLKSLGLNPDIIRAVSICAYESEMNVVMHGGEGILSMTVDDTGIILEVKDDGPGIGDLTLALAEGYSTAQEVYREMGFGAGMGLPNIVRNSDYVEIYSKKDKGTYLIISFWMNQRV
ncbi:anti-sigma regulatory factor [Deltaproteobacteria bacterium]|nr:anti-sigma regulatory factor [Deltaproteobacteria bacterium]